VVAYDPRCKFSITHLVAAIAVLMSVTGTISGRAAHKKVAFDLLRYFLLARPDSPCPHCLEASCCHYGGY